MCSILYSFLRGLASGSGDTTVRIWDTNTELPHFTCTGHKNWVLCIAWSPDGNKIASACKNGQVRFTFFIFLVSIYLLLVDYIMEC